MKLSNNPDAHPEIIKVWTDLYAKLKELRLRKRIIKVKERRIRLLEKQAEEAREAMQDSQLSAEQKAEIYRQIFKPSFDEPDKAQTDGFTDGQKRAISKRQRKHSV